MGHSKYLKQMHLIAESKKIRQLINYDRVALVDSLGKRCSNFTVSLGGTTIFYAIS